MGRAFSFDLKTGGCGLIVPVGMLLISWLLRWRRRHNGMRRAAAILAPLSLGALYVLFDVLLALS
ncbi:hypothetical protein [Streptomyces inhibens]|uniref:hypothetical protein n=1 Tax=Streptomyces inhibens TaxID=2293571 RepID=UPI001EE77CE5|nr:hypothetical protein [Streptomyces inhibens]UKY47441.1 hypothetical protein KI385_00310 [Streptomyces inhibens]